MKQVVVYLLLFVAVLYATTEEEEKEITIGKICDFFYRLKKGTITKNNVEDVLPTLGKAKYDCGREALIKEYDANKNGTLDNIEMLKLSQKFLLQLFHLFDKENKSFITTEDLGKIIKGTDQKYAEANITGILEYFEPEDGKVSLKVYKEKILVDLVDSLDKLDELSKQLQTNFTLAKPLN